MRKKTIEYLKSLSTQIGFICTSRKYKDSKTKLTFLCTNGHRFRSSWYKLCRFKQCPKCLRGYQERFVRMVVELLLGRKFVKIRPDWLKYPVTKRNLELDMFDGDLAFEYNGKQHYKVIRAFRGTKKKLQSQILRDEFKKMRCKELGITLITIPQLFDMLDPYSIKDFIKQSLIDVNYSIPENYDSIVIDVDSLLAKAKHKTEYKI